MFISYLFFEYGFFNHLLELLERNWFVEHPVKVVGVLQLICNRTVQEYLDFIPINFAEPVVFLKLSGGFLSVHDGHVHIHDHKAKRSWFLQNLVDGVLSIECCLSEKLEAAVEQFVHRKLVKGVIVDYEY